MRASFRGQILPAPKGSEANDEGFGWVTVRSAPLKLKVTANPAPPTAADDPLGMLPYLQRQAGDRLPGHLLRPVNLAKGIDATPLKDALEFFADRYDVTLLIDEMAFKKIGKERIGEAKVELPAVEGISRAAALYFLLAPLDATLEFRNDQVVVVPLAKPQGLAERLRPARLEFEDSLKAEIAVEEGIDAGTPLATALAQFGDRYDLLILIDQRAFELAGIKDIARRPVSLAKLGKSTRSDALRELLKPAGATFVARDEYLVLVIPGG